jgi:hypothetical protein
MPDQVDAERTIRGREHARLERGAEPPVAAADVQHASIGEDGLGKRLVGHVPPHTPRIVALVRRGHAGLVSFVSAGPEDVLPADGAPGRPIWRAGIFRAPVAYFRISSTRFCVSARIGAMAWVVVTIVWIPLTMARLTSMMFFTGSSACAY